MESKSEIIGRAVAIVDGMTCWIFPFEQYHVRSFAAGESR
jgi:hypothetical protein